MKHATTEFLFAYWNEIRAGRLAPKRFEIEPARMGAILPDTFILEGDTLNGFSFRLAGTRIADRFNADLRHVDFSADWSKQDQARIRNLLEEVTKRGAVARFDVDVSDGKGNWAQLEYVLLPLIHSSETIDRIVGAISALDSPAWLEFNPIVSRSIRAVEIIWPDVGADPEGADNTTEDQVIAPHVRTARIVRVDRRQFRVYEGGLASPSTNSDDRS